MRDGGGVTDEGKGDWRPATLYSLGFLTLIATFN